MEEREPENYLGTQTLTRTYTSGENILWNVQTCDTSGSCSFADSNFTFQMDSEAPNISIESPNATFDYNEVGGNETLNTTITDSNNLDSCWYNYKGTNQTFSCSSGVKYTEIFELEDYGTDHNLTVYANDTLGNTNSNTTNWSYKIFQINRTYSDTIYETAQELYRINISVANQDLLGVATLKWNGTSYSTTKSTNGNYITYTRNHNIPLGSGTIPHNWSISYDEDIIESENKNQTLENVVFTHCNSTYTDDFLKVLYKDEATRNSMNASIPSSEFTYYLGTGVYNKTYYYSNSTEANNSEDSFCFSPTSEQVNVELSLKYKADSYPQRIWNPDTLTLNSSAYEKILYLLDDLTGRYTTFQVINQYEQPIQGVSVLAERDIEGETIVIGDKTTDSAGSVTFWNNPDAEHTYTFTHPDYETTTRTLYPTQGEYTLTMGVGTGDVNESLLRGIDYEIKPKDIYLDQNTEYDFSFNITSSYWDLSNSQYELYYGNGTLVSSNSSTSDDGSYFLIENINTTNSESMYMDWSYTANGTTKSYTKEWIVISTEGRQFSIIQFFTDLKLYLDSEGSIFGMSEAGRAMLSFFLIFGLTVGLIYGFGVKNEEVVLGFIFIITLIFDIGVGLVPPINTPFGEPIHGLPTAVAFIVFLISVIKKEILYL